MSCLIASQSWGRPEGGGVTLHLENLVWEESVLYCEVKCKLLTCCSKFMSNFTMNSNHKVTIFSPRELNPFYLSFDHPFVIVWGKQRKSRIYNILLKTRYDSICSSALQREKEKEDDVIFVCYDEIIPTHTVSLI